MDLGIMSQFKPGFLPQSVTFPMPSFVDRFDYRFSNAQFRSLRSGMFLMGLSNLGSSSQTGPLSPVLGHFLFLRIYRDQTKPLGIEELPPK